MAVSTIKTVSVSVKLENGHDSEGNMKYVSTSLGTVSKDNFDDDKALAIVELLKPCLAKTVGSTEKHVTSVITAE